MAHTLMVQGIDRVDLMALKEELPPGSVAQTEPSAPVGATDRVGDLGLTAAIVIVSIAAIDALALWMAKRHIEAKDRQRVKFKKGPDGVEIELDINRSLSASDEVNEKLYQANRGALLDQIKALANVDLSS